MYMNFNFFFVPFFYFIKTRAKSDIKVISWVLIYIFPIFIFDFIYNHQLSFKSILISAFIYTLYEIGYIYNDTETIKKEKKPTIRLREESFSFYEGNKVVIYFSRLIIAILLNVFYVYLYNDLNINYIWFILPVFFVYNLTRSRFNLILHFFLVILRYSLPFYIFTNDIYSILFSCFLFPIINLIERCSEQRFNISNFQKFILSNKKNGRYIYYFIVFIVFLFLHLQFKFIDISYVLIAFYYFLFRYLSYTFVNS